MTQAETERALSIGRVPRRTDRGRDRVPACRPVRRRTDSARRPPVRRPPGRGVDAAVARQGDLDRTPALPSAEYVPVAAAVRDCAWRPADACARRPAGGYLW